MIKKIKSNLKLSILAFGAILTSFISSSSYAVLDIEITQGVDTAVPLAIFPFSNENSGDANVDVIAQVVSSDLSRSGLFIPKLYPSALTSHVLSELPLVQLQRQQAEYVIKGTIEPNSYGRYQVTVDLVSLYQILDIEAKQQDTIKNIDKSDSIPSKNPSEQYAKAVLLSKSFNIAGDQLRNLAHHISDLVYERLTGIRGVFSSKIAYVNVITQRDNKREYVLEVADSDGYNPQRLIVSSEPIMSPSWSPDAREIAYVSFLGNRSKIKIVELASGKSRIVSNFKGINGAPSWSPDGSKLALVLSNEKEPNIYILNLSNKKLTQITDSQSIDTEPRWAPDGSSLIFTSNRGGGPQIYQYFLADRKIRRLTYEGNYNARGSFTPDGKKLVLLHRNSKRDAFQIAVQDLSTDNLDIVSNSTMDESPSVSANGQQIIYATKDGERGILAEVSIDGRVKIKRPAQIGDVQEPSWSPYIS